MPANTAKIIWDGRSQLVQLPPQYCIDADQVQIWQHGDVLILKPIADDWGWLDRVAGGLDPTFAAASAEEPIPQHRLALSYFP